MENAVRTSFNKPFETRNTMSAFTQKEIAALTTSTKHLPADLKIPPLKAFIAEVVSDRAEWDTMYIAAWRILTSMRALCERNTTDKIIYYWGIPFTPRSFTDKNGQSVRVHCILSSEADEQQLMGIWKHDHGRLTTLFTALADPQYKNVLEDFKLEEILFESIDLQSEYKLLTWVAKEGTLPIIADNAVFIRTAVQPRSDKAKRAPAGKPESGNIHTIPKPKPHFANGKVAGTDQRNKATGGERAYSRGNTPTLQHVDDSPYSNRKGENAKRHDRRKAGGKKRRNKWDD